MTKFDCIFINGDSYSEQRMLDTPRYGDFLSQMLGNIPVKNLAKGGSTNDRILRSSIEHIYKLKQEYQNPLIIIGWTFIRRSEVWYYGKNTDSNVLQSIPDISDNPHSRLCTLDWLINIKEATTQQKLSYLENAHIHKALTDFYTNLYLFANLLESQNLNYIFFSAANNMDCPTANFPFIDKLFQTTWVNQNTNICNLHEFCITNWAKENDPEAHPVTGHLSTVGHEKFAHYLLNIMVNKNLTSVQNAV